MGFLEWIPSSRSFKLVACLDLAALDSAAEVLVLSAARPPRNYACRLPACVGVEGPP